MNNDLSVAEKQFADIKAAEYRAKGYEVSQEAPLEFLPGYRADLLVQMGDETKVIEIKTRPSLVANPYLREFKRIIDARPGWSFELLLVGDPESLDITATAQPLDESGIISRLALVSTALDAGFTDGAFLLAWSAAEAVIRMLVSAEGVTIERATDPAYILGMAVAHGAISRDQYDKLTEFMQYRNAIAHGFEVTDFGGRQVTELVATITLLLNEYHEPVINVGADV